MTTATPRWMQTSRQPLNNAEALLSDAIAARGTLELSETELQRRTAMLVHELRNPLNGIIGAASLIRFSDGSANTGLSSQRLLEIIEKSGKHMLSLVSEIIEVALDREGQLPMRPTRVDLRHMVRESLDIVKPLALAKDIPVSLHVEKSVPQMVMLDPLRIKQVLINLLGNAIRFTDGGGIDVAVDDSVGSTGTVGPSIQSLRFVVQDTGVGMKESQLLDLLTCLDGPLECAPREIVRRGGAGLGLHVSQKILRGMSSRLQISSTPGHGTRAWFSVMATFPERDVSSPTRA